MKYKQRQSFQDTLMMLILSRWYNKESAEDVKWYHYLILNIIAWSFRTNVYRRSC